MCKYKWVFCALVVILKCKIICTRFMFTDCSNGGLIKIHPVVYATYFANRNRQVLDCLLFYGDR